MQSIIQHKPGCKVCGNPNTETHHVLFGRGNRALSERFGLTVELCPDHHRGPAGPHFDREFDLALKKEAQEAFEREHPEKDFLRIFGRSYK